MVLRFALVAVVLAAAASAFGTLSSPSPEPAPRWHRYSLNPIIVPGFTIRPGGPVGVTVADASVLYDEDERRWKMWFSTGWDDKGRSRTGIKYAESSDGIVWAIGKGLALAPSAVPSAWDATHAESPSVVMDPSAPPERRYMLWYSGGNTTRRSMSQGVPYYQIGLAFSRDGRRFTRIPAAESPYAWAGLVLVVQHALPAFPQVTDGVLADPDVLLKGGIFHMWFSTIALNRRGGMVTGGIGHAISENGVSWHASRKNPLPSLMRERPIAPSTQPSVVWNPRKGSFEMWYTNDRAGELEELRPEAREFATSGYWYASSRDGEEWFTLHGAGRDFQWDKHSASERYGLVTGVEVVLRKSEYRMYYNALGTSKAPPRWPHPAIWAMNLAIRR
ncbi:MAG: hypothetical protein ACRDGN_09535 [bacterium]